MSIQLAFIRLPSVDETNEFSFKAEKLVTEEKSTSESDVKVDFFSGTEKLKRKNGFDFPSYSKKLRASDDEMTSEMTSEITSSPSLSDSNSSLKKLISERTKSKIISWRRNTKSLTDQIVMNK